MSAVLLRFDGIDQARMSIGAELWRHVALNVGGADDGSVRVVTAAAIYDDSNPPVQTTAETVADGFFCWLWGIDLPADLEAYADAAAAVAAARRVYPEVLGG